jgi:hypothetical protein
MRRDHPIRCNSAPGAAHTGFASNLLLASGRARGYRSHFISDVRLFHFRPHCMGSPQARGSFRLVSIASLWTVRIQTIKFDGLSIALPVKSEGVNHIDGEAFQFVKLVSGDEDR